MPSSRNFVECVKHITAMAKANRFHFGNLAGIIQLFKLYSTVEIPRLEKILQEGTVSYLHLATVRKLFLVEMFFAFH